MRGHLRKHGRRSPGNPLGYRLPNGRDRSTDLAYDSRSGPARRRPPGNRPRRRYVRSSAGSGRAIPQEPAPALPVLLSVATTSRPVRSIPRFRQLLMGGRPVPWAETPAPYSSSGVSSVSGGTSPGPSIAGVRVLIVEATATASTRSKPCSWTRARRSSRSRPREAHPGRGAACGDRRGGRARWEAGLERGRLRVDRGGRGSFTRARSARRTD